jgi:hypothetical protein
MTNPSRFKFSRNRNTTVKNHDSHTLSACQTLIDTFYQMHLTIFVSVPELEIVDIKAHVDYSIDPVENKAIKELSRLKNFRIGPGLRKVIKGLVSEDIADSQLIFMFEEACQGIILNLTREMATQLPDHQDIDVQVFRDMVKTNTRLYNRCAAYSKGSTLVEGLDLKQEEIGNQ